jgi:predicted lipoprotein with Yx(FWY)xxD motif
MKALLAPPWTTLRATLPPPARWRARTLAIAAAAVLAAGISTVPASAHAEPASATTASAPVVLTAAPTAYGPALFTSGGRALYLRSFDALTGPALPLHSTCTGSCATAWPPLLAPGPNGPFAASHGVNASELGTVQRPDGTYQVTYFGHPLYEFIADTSPGDVNGENVTAFDAFWHLDTLAGLPAPGAAKVILENSADGLVLAAPTANGYRSLYLLTYDLPAQATGTGPCTAIWPPLLTNREPAAGPGVSRGALGILSRPDGTRQVTYHGHPVYLFAFDLGAGAPSGLTGGEYLVDQLAHGVWWLLGADGKPVPGPLSVASMSSSQGQVLAVNPPSAFAARPFAVYAFSADSAGTSACTGTCARFWPPVLVSGTPTAASGSGVQQSGLGTITRPDGTTQVTYFGHPLYFFAFDQPGQDLGEGISAFGGTFTVVSLTGVPEKRGMR